MLAVLSMAKHSCSTALYSLIWFCQPSPSLEVRGLWSPEAFVAVE